MSAAGLGRVERRLLRKAGAMLHELGERAGTTCCMNPLAREAMVEAVTHSLTLLATATRLINELDRGNKP